MGASALVIAAAFAVAFAVLVSAPTQTADAQIQSITTGEGDANAANAANGDTVLVADEAATAEASVVEFKILPSSTADASFTHSAATNNGQDIICQIDTSCDVKIDTDTPKDGVLDDLDGIQVAMKISDDSPGGFIIVTSRKLTGTDTTTVTTNVVTVKVAQVPAKLEVKPVAKAISASDTTVGTLLDIRLTDTNGNGIAGKKLTIVSNRALLSAAGATDTTADADTDPDNARTIGTGDDADELTLGFSSTVGVLAGTVDTSTDADADAGGTADTIDSRGYARVRVTGTGAATPGVSTITVTLGTVTGTATVTLYGPVATITAEADASAIELGGKTLIVVTATDKGGNNVSGVRANVKAGAKGVVGPTGSTASTEVTVRNTVNKDASPYGDLSRPGSDIPACGTVAVADAVEADPDANPPVEAANAVARSTGTNGDGQCVIEVEAQNPSGTANDAMRGSHMITINALSAVGNLADTKVDAVIVEIAVGGPPDSITSDAPARIDPSDELTVNVAVVDDEDVHVGSVYVTVTQTDGPGAIITDAPAKTTDGRAKFTYLASSRPDVVEFLVRTYDKDPNAAGAKVTAKLPIIVQIGAEADETPTAPSLSRQPFSSGFTLVTFSGGTVDELATALTDACGDGVRAWATGDTGEYVSFFPSAPAVVNSAFNSRFQDGVPANEPLLVGNCGG